MPDQPSNEDLLKIEAEVNEMVAKIKHVVSLYKAADMDTDRIIERVGQISMYSGLTRTTALGSVVYAAMYGFITGLSEDQLVNSMREIYTIASQTPGAIRSAERYAKDNAEYHAKAAPEFEGVKGFVLPGDGKVH